MIFGSVCSGIEAASVAWAPLGWKAAWFAEIDRFPSAVLAHRYPETPNHGDLASVKEKVEPGSINLLVGGTPCQGFSIAGLRGGLGDDRSNLALEFLRLAGVLRPDWLVWENVPGVLSSNRGRDFGAFLGGLAELGYGWSYRVLDAQYVRVDGFGRAVPQRRRRVFVVGHSGDWRRAAAVLFDRESLSGNPPPGRETRSSVAALTANGVGTCGADDNQGQAGHLIASDVSLCLNAGGMNRQDYETERLVAHSLRADGFDASEDGTGRGTPLVPVAYQCQGSNVGEMGTLRSGNGNVTGGVPFVTGFQSSQSGLRQVETHATLDANNGSRRHNGVMLASGVRRLTPVECERLMGFPDRWTGVPYRGKPAKDGPRYKSLGNSMAVNCMRWIGRRIELVDAIRY